MQLVLWSLGAALLQNHLIFTSNPFIGSMLTGLLVVAVLVRLSLLRRRGWAYAGAALLGFVVLTTLFSYIDGRLYPHKRRYYGFVDASR